MLELPLLTHCAALLMITSAAQTEIFIITMNDLIGQKRVKKTSEISISVGEGTKTAR